MKYAAIVLRNTKNPLSSVDYSPVHDALLSGGVFLDELVFLSYDAPSETAAAISRLSLECDGVFLICDSVLVPSAQNTVPFSRMDIKQVPRRFACQTQRFFQPL